MICLVMLLLAWAGGSAKVYLVSAGIEDYTHFPQKANNLPNTCNDAKGVQYVYNKNKAQTSLLLNSQATRQALLNNLRSTFANAKEDDIVVFFFSGHGLPGGICAYDGILPYEDIIETISKCKSKNKMLFIHSCHSGTLRSEALKGDDHTIKKAKDANVMLFLSSRGNQYSWTNNFSKYSFFADALQNGLRGKADTNRDRKITAKELYVYVVDKVTKATKGAQHPVMWGNFSDDMPVMIW